MTKVSKKVRILCIMPTLDKCGGIESFFMNYYKNLSDIFKVDFITHECDSEEYKNMIALKNDSLFIMPRLGLKTMTVFIKQVRRFFKEHHDYDIIHCNMANAAYFYFKEAEKYGINIRIIHSHECKYADKLLHAFRNVFLIKLGKKYATHYLSCGTEAGKFLFKKNFTVINNAIDFDRFKYNSEERKIIRKELNIADDEILLGNVGRLAPVKNQVFLLNLLEKLDLKRYKLVIIGNGELRDNLLKIAKNKGIDNNVVFIPSTGKIENYYNAIDIFLLPSIYEGFPVAGIEAQAAGLPCLFSDTITNELKITNKACFLSLNDLNAWSNAVNSMPIDERNDNDIYDSKYNIKTSVKNLEKYYLKCIE